MDYRLPSVAQDNGILTRPTRGSLQDIIAQLHSSKIKQQESPLQAWMDESASVKLKGTLAKKLLENNKIKFTL